MLIIIIGKFDLYNFSQWCLFLTGLLFRREKVIASDSNYDLNRKLRVIQQTQMA